MQTHTFLAVEARNILAQLTTCKYSHLLWLVILNPLFSFRSIRNFIIDVRQSVLFSFHLIVAS